MLFVAVVLLIIHQQVPRPDVLLVGRVQQSQILPLVPDLGQETLVRH